MRRGVLCAGLAVICLPPVSGAQSLMLTESEALARLSVDGPRVRAVRAPIQVAQADTQAAIARTVRLPQGYRIEYGGQFESQQSASRRLFVLGVGITIGMFMLLVPGVDDRLDSHPNDGHGRWLGADPSGDWRGETRQRDSDADGDCDSVWIDIVHAAQHGGRSYDVSEVRTAIECS